MAQWPPSRFDDVGLANPYAPGNVTIRREALAATRHLSGAVVQCGVYQGRSLGTLAWLLREWGDTRPVWGCDSFAGLPQGTSPDGADTPAGRLGDTSHQMVREWLDSLQLSSVTLVAGLFAETLPSLPVASISVLILDCDLYASYRDALTHLYPRVQSGGWMVFDEYFSPRYPGARIAVDEFFADKPERPILATHLLPEHPYERWYVVKGGGQ